MGLGDYIMYRNTERNFEVRNIKMLFISSRWSTCGLHVLSMRKKTNKAIENVLVVRSIDVTTIQNDLNNHVTNCHDAKLKTCLKVTLFLQWVGSVMSVREDLRRY